MKILDRLFKHQSKPEVRPYYRDRLAHLKDPNGDIRSPDQDATEDYGRNYLRGLRGQPPIEGGPMIGNPGYKAGLKARLEKTEDGADF
jgi:hypothetical protein